MPVLEGVGPDLYRVNPFRVTGLSIYATSRDIRRRQDEFQISARLGTAGTGTVSPLPLDPPPDLDTVQEAIQRLRDPVQRVEDELCWFWPAHHAAMRNTRDEALEALREGQIQEAVQIWSDPAPGRAAAVAEHNLAVLALARALDQSIADATGRELWTQALTHWRSTVDNDAFWDLVAARVRAADDPRVAPDAASELRERLPSALLSIGAALAVQAACQGDHGSARWLAGLLGRCGFGAQTAVTALRDAVGQETARLRATGKAATERVSADPSQGLTEAVALLDATETLLEVFDDLLPDNDALVTGSRDEAATNAMRCVVQYVNGTNDWGKAAAPLERALSVAATEASRGQVRKNLETIRDNAVYATCWFCRARPADDGWTYEIMMYGDVNTQMFGYGQLRTTWQKATAKVPRCTDCGKLHAVKARNVWMRGGIGTVVVAASAIAMIDGGAGLAAFATIACGALALIVYVLIAKPNHGLPDDDFMSIRDFPPIKKHLASGWLYGTGPT